MDSNYTFLRKTQEGIFRQAQYKLFMEFFSRHLSMLEVKLKMKTLHKGKKIFFI